jgi:protein subunit release factor A
VGDPLKEVAMPVIVEIRAAEGGADAKLLCYEQYNVYRKMEVRGCL